MVALLGTVDAERVNESPSVNAIDVLLRLIWETKIASTITAHGELATPFAIAVIVALPTWSAVIVPSDTETTELLLLDQVIPS